MTSLKTVEQMSRSCEKNRRQVCRARRRRVFTPNRTYKGVMGFEYTVQDAQGNYTEVTSSTGQTKLMKAAVYLQTSDIPNDPLVVEQWYLAHTNYYGKHSCLRTYLLNCRHKRPSKYARKSAKRAPVARTNTNNLATVGIASSLRATAC